MPRHMRVKFLKANEEEIILKATREKKCIITNLNYWGFLAEQNNVV